MPAVKKNPVVAHFFGETKEIINGEVVNDTAVKGEYDGKILHVDKRDNNQIAHYDIKLKNLLSTPSGKMNLFERLNKDFGKQSSKRSSKRSSKQSSKRSSKQSSKQSSKRTSKRKHKTKTKTKTKSQPA